MSTLLRKLIRSPEVAWRLIGTNVKVSSLGQMSDKEALSVSLTASGITNPYTKDMPKIYFQSATTQSDWKRALAAYQGKSYLIVPPNSPNYFKISWFQSDFILVGDLYPAEEDMVVSRELLLEAMLGEKGASSQSNGVRA